METTEEQQEIAKKLVFDTAEFISNTFPPEDQILILNEIQGILESKYTDEIENAKKHLETQERIYDSFKSSRNS